MSLYFAAGSPTTELSDQDLREAWRVTWNKLGTRTRAADTTRLNAAPQPGRQNHVYGP